VTGKIAISGYPSSKTDLTQVDSILNLDKYTPYRTDGRYQQRYLIDGEGNDPAAIAEVVLELDKLLTKGRVLVHCASGVSRSPFVIALYLAWKHGLGFEEALDVVRHRRSTSLNVDAGLLAIKDKVLQQLNGNNHS